MNQVLEQDEMVKEERPRKGPRDEQLFELTIYQIADDSLMKQNRSDGTGWEWLWADWQRAWMDATPSRFAYRCLPLTIANQTGLWVNNPVAFTANWRGEANPQAIDFDFGGADQVWEKWITNLFGSGIITWNTPFLFRTQPEGSRLMVSGPVNYFKDNAHALTAIIESDWMVMSFTMNYKMMRPNEPVRFEVGEPLFQVLPMHSNICQDLQKASIHYRKLDDDPEISRSYREWDKSRTEFTQKNQSGQLKGDDWQRDYFLGRDAAGRQLAPVHMTKVKPPKVIYDGTAKPPASAVCPATRAQSRPQGGDLTAKASESPVQAALEKTGGSGDAVVRNGVTTAVASAEPVAPRITDEWRLWIAENLMLGASRESILERMVAEGLARADSAAEIERASQSPYLRAAQRMQNRLKKRDWMMATYRKLNRIRPESGAIERRAQLSSDAFLEGYYSANRPVIITGLIDEWPALKKWGLEYFAEEFSKREIDLQIAAPSDGNGGRRRDPYRRKMAFSAFIESSRASGGVPAFSIAAADSGVNREVLYDLTDDIARAPEYLDGGAPRNDILSFAPAGTITPFRHELANLLMAQVAGRRRIRFAPSWDTPLMRNLVHVYSDLDGRVTPTTPPTSLAEPQILEFILEAGELFFLPVGSWSFIEVLETSVSLTFNRFACDDNDYRSFYETFQSV